MLPSGVPTFLFTDIADSTRLWERHPDAMRGAVAWHDELLVGAVAAGGGTVVKTTGDGVLAVFADAASAVDAAVASQRSLGGRDFDGVGALEVRMGLNSGEAFERGGDYFGTAVNRTARIMGAAHGRQILLAEATAAMARSTGWTTVELGLVQLRGLAQPERIHQVVADGLPRTFPPLVGGPQFPNNLPATTTDFIGRSADIEAVAEQLRGRRLVTITGPGGIGKTRLALEVAARAGPAFRDGAWFADLSGAADGDHAVDAVALLFGVIEEPGRSLIDGIGAYLAGRHVLLVLDNCEQVLGQMRAAVDAWLRAVPNLRVLATSRERLAADGESVWPVGPLGRGAALGDEAVQLFIARAEAVNPHLALAEQVGAVQALCRELDGIPLAIELAAARVSALTPAQIHQRLDRHFRILRRRADPHRHGSLHAAIEWSYELLEPGEARFFAVLSVFPGGFDLGAAEAMAGVADVAVADVVDLLTSLVEKSLVNSELGGAEVRYRYLETLRQFGLGRLEEAEMLAAAREAQAAWALALVGEEVVVLETEQGAWESRLRERRNLDQAMSWMIEEGDAHGATQLAAGMYTVWQWLAYRDGLDWYRRILAMPSLEPGDRILALCSAAWLEWSFGKPAESKEMMAEAHRMAEERGLQLPLQGLGVRTLIASFNDEPELAFELAAQAQERANTTEDAAELAAAGFALVWAYVGVGRFAEAKEIAERALPFARSTGNDFLLTVALMGMAVAERAVDPERALELLDEAVDLAEASGARWHLAAATLHRGYCWLVRKEPTRSMEEFAQAVRLAHEVEDHRAASSAVEAIASWAARTGRPEDAVRLFAGAARIRTERTGVPGLRVEIDHRERVLDRLRGELGDDFDRVWKTGTELEIAALMAAAEQLGRELAAAG